MTGAALPAEEGNPRTVGVFLEIGELFRGELALGFAHGWGGGGERGVRRGGRGQGAKTRTGTRRRQVAVGILRATETCSRAEKRGGSDGYTRPALAPSGVLLVEEERV